RLSNTRFWSKALSLDEWREHVRNYNSVGVENPLANWNYVHNVTGSWGRLRMNTMVKQDTRNADSLGNITFLDFSENKLHMTGSGFQPNKKQLSVRSLTSASSTRTLMKHRLTTRFVFGHSSILTWLNRRPGLS